MQHFSEPPSDVSGQPGALQPSSSNTMLTTSIIQTTGLPENDANTMFGLYNRYYGGAERNIFRRDLATKDYVIVLRDVENIIRGFSTLAVYTERFKDQTVRVLYSGDTIIEQMYWGQNQFSKEWLTFAGRIKAENPELPLFWLLIVKGHRTYRYLSLFSTEYFPRYNCATSPEFAELMEHLGTCRFGNAYDAKSGLVRFAQPRSFLNEQLVVIPEKDSRRPDVKYFLERNPHYGEGDELLCLCELSAEKLTRMARQWFELGLH